MKRFLLAFVVALFVSLLLAACHDLRRAGVAHPLARASAAASAEPGTFDNHEQVWREAESATKAAPPPHVVVTIDATDQPEWTIWHIHLDATPALDATWALRNITEADGTTTLTPYRALVAAPVAAPKLDATQWTALDACALRAKAGAEAQADPAACAAIAPGVGADAALLPLAIGRDGERLHVRLYADQARGADAREDLRLVRWFGGWAAVNGAGPKGDAGSRDWHMDRSVRIGSEGGRYPLKWRDGNASGYSLTLERLTYREGNVPVLKLSVVEDADQHAIAYAWANPEATAIGINLGWVQVGLQQQASAAAPEK